MKDIWCYLLYLAIVGGGFCLILSLGDIFFDTLYRISPRFRKWSDKHFGN